MAITSSILVAFGERNRSWWFSKKLNYKYGLIVANASPKLKGVLMESLDALKAWFWHQVWRKWILSYWILSLECSLDP